ncbi:MAG: FliO/MopB family protein, partial [Armatimonadota bacterium]
QDLETPENPRVPAAVSVSGGDRAAGRTVASAQQGVESATKTVPNAGKASVAGRSAGATSGGWAQTGASGPAPRTDPAGNSGPGRARVTPQQVQSPVRSSMPQVDAGEPESPARAGEVADTVQTSDGEKKRPDKMWLMAQHREQSRLHPRRDSNLLSTALATAAKLILVLALAYVTILVLKMLTSSRQLTSGPSGHLRVLDTVRLSATNSLHVVSAGGKLLLVGSSGSRLELLAELGYAEPTGTEPAHGGRFAEYLSRYSSGETTPTRRLARLLRDCAVEMREKCGGHRLGEREAGKNEA